MKIAKWCAMGMGIFLVLALLAALISNIVFAHQFRKTLARLQVEGRPVTIAELKPTPIPVDRNAAPMVEKAALLLTNTPVPTAIQELTRLAHENFILGARDFPENKRDMLMRLIEEPENKALFAILRQAAEKPNYNAQLEYEKAPAFRTPSFLATRQLMEILSLKAEAAAYAGNGKEAGQALLDGFRLSYLLKQEPLMIQILLSVASDRILTNSLYRITNNLDLPADTLQSLETELESHLDDTAFVRAIDENRVITALAGYQIMLNGTYREIQIVINDERIPPPIIMLYRMSGLLHRDMAVFLTLQADIQDKCRMPSDKVLVSMRQIPMEKQIPVFCPISRIGLRALEPVLNTKARYEAILQVTRVGLALKRYKMAHGVYPDALTYLEPAFPAKLPKDPCSGNDLLYRKEGDGFLLYSVGSDQQDNRGAEPNLKSPSAPYDIAWKSMR